MAKKEKKPKEPKPKKEKKPKEPKPKKEKKPKAPKPKKEKKPKPPKQPKPKKEKKPKGEDAEGGKGGGKKKLLLIALPVVAVAAIGAVLMFTGVLNGILGKGGDGAEEGEPTEDAESAEEGEAGEGGEEDAEAGEGGEGGEGGEDAEEVLLDENGEPIEPTPRPTQQPSMTPVEMRSYIESLSPAVLGLEGEDMSAYEVFPSEGVSYIRDPETGQNLTCSRIQIFSKGELSGANDIEGVYLVTRGGARRLFRYDEEADSWTELSLTP